MSDPAPTIPNKLWNAQRVDATWLMFGGIGVLALLAGKLVKLKVFGGGQ